MVTRRRALAGSAGVVLAAGGLPGCALLQRPSPIPMDVIHDRRGCADTLAPTLLVVLPGAHMAPAELVREGFVAAVRERGLAIDVALPDAHLGYVYDGSMLRRVHDEIVAPARAQGYRQVYLAGISLGGFVALGYTMKHPGEIAGVLTIAPYLGRRPLVQAIADAGGPAIWRRTAQPRDAADIDHELWMWLSALPPTAPPLWLSYGTEDRLAPGHRLWAGLLPPGRVDTVPGDHDWPPWRRLWSQWLDRAPLSRLCTA